MGTIVCVTHDISRLVEDIRRLSDEERIRLVEQIFSMLEPESDGDLAELWSQEIARRSREIEEGSVQGIPWSEVKAEARRRARGRP